MFTISDAASLALHTVVLLSDRPGERLSTRQISSAIQVSEHHLAKVLQRLTKAGLVQGTRGPSGGFTLARDPATVTLLEVYEAVDGPLNADACLMHGRACGATACILGDVVVSANRKVKQYMTRTKLSALRGTYAPKGG